MGCGGFSVNTVEREMTESAGLVKDTGFVRNFKPGLSKDIGEFYAKYKGLKSKAEQISATDELVALWAKSAKQYKELDNHKRWNKNKCLNSRI
ncbi:MAG: hypothetical protein MR481_07220 [Campylobacter sp.]|uniref:hypothetical protein n=1 Tax=Campylobacter sp. TaxID=205 RepID=UPI002AA7FF8D|nr:hypothetical protein [Campylobacter sp.]MCI7247697.1 hypothetical protein [Campylobacter sp.]